MTEEVHPRLALPLPLHFPAVVVEDAERIEAELLTVGVVGSVADLVFLLLGRQSGHGADRPCLVFCHCLDHSPPSLLSYAGMEEFL